MYGTLCDRLGRLFQRIDLRRVPRDAVTLQDYLPGATLPWPVAMPFASSPLGPRSSNE
jgi:hypothetical protein